MLPGCLARLGCLDRQGKASPAFPGALGPGQTRENIFSSGALRVWAVWTAKEKHPPRSPGRWAPGRPGKIFFRRVSFALGLFGPPRKRISRVPRAVGPRADQGKVSPQRSSDRWAPGGRGKCLAAGVSCSFNCFQDPRGWNPREFPINSSPTKPRFGQGIAMKTVTQKRTFCKRPGNGNRRAGKRHFSPGNGNSRTSKQIFGERASVVFSQGMATAGRADKSSECFVKNKRTRGVLWEGAKIVQ